MVLVRGIGQESAEKQAPSALDFFGHIKTAIDVESNKFHKKVAMATWVTNLVSDFNKDTKVKKYRIDAVKKKMILNLLRSPDECRAILALHYDFHRHNVSGRLTLNDFTLLEIELQLTDFSEFVVAPLALGFETLASCDTFVA